MNFYANKAHRHIVRLAEHVRGSPIIPVTLDMDLTDQCNCECPDCAGGRGDSTMDVSIATHIIDQAAHIGVKSIVFTGGGEPTIHPALPHLLEYTRSKGMSVALVTNATLLGSEPDLINAIIKFCTWVRCSLDASNREEYIETHGVDKFVAAIDGIYYLTRERCYCNTPTIGVAHLTGPKTLDLRKAAELVRSLGADYLYLRPYLGDRTPVYLRYIKDQYNTDRFQVVSAMAYDHFHETERPYKSCGFGWWVSVVKADGTLTWCCHTRQHPYAHLGDLKSEELLSALSRRRSIKIQWDKCPMFCRGDQLNRFLWEVKQPVMHEEFL